MTLGPPPSLASCSLGSYAIGVRGSPFCAAYGEAVFISGDGESMNAFESLVALLLRREGYWTQGSFKVNLTKAEKRAIGRPSSPRWEIDVVAYQGKSNEILAVECKSYLDSAGVLFKNDEFSPSDRYKLFSEAKLRSVVLGRLGKQLAKVGLCAPNPTIKLCLAAGKISSGTDKESLNEHFEGNGWLLFDDSWIRKRLAATADSAYEDDVAHVASKILLRGNHDDTREQLMLSQLQLLSSYPAPDPPMR